MFICVADHGGSEEACGGFRAPPPWMMLLDAQPLEVGIKKQDNPKERRRERKWTFKSGGEIDEGYLRGVYF